MNKSITVSYDQLNDWCNAHRQNRMFKSSYGQILAFKRNDGLCSHLPCGYDCTFTVKTKDNEVKAIYWDDSYGRTGYKKGEEGWCIYSYLANYIVKIFGKKGK